MAKEIQKAAIKCKYKVYTGFEHGECFKQIEDWDKDSEVIEGFVTNDGDFVNRKEAMVIAKIAGQLQYGMDKETLISEDLHVDWLHKQEKLILKLQSELDSAKKTIELFKLSNDALRQENLDLSYNQIDNVYETAKEMSENWERNYQQEILDLKTRLANSNATPFIIKKLEDIKREIPHLITLRTNETFLVDGKKFKNYIDSQIKELQKENKNV